MSILNAHYLVAAIIDPFEVGWRSKIEGELKSVVGSIQLDQVFDGAQRFEGDDVIA